MGFPVFFQMAVFEAEVCVCPPMLSLLLCPVRRLHQVRACLCLIEAHSSCPACPLGGWETALKVVVILKVVSAQDTERVSWVRSLVSSPTGLEHSPTEAQDCVAVHYYTLHFHCMLFWFVFFFLTYSKILSLIKIWKSKNTDLVVVFSNVLYKCYF